VTSVAGDSALAAPLAVPAVYGPLEDGLLGGPFRFHRLDSVATSRYTTQAAGHLIISVRASRHGITPALIL